MNNLYLRLKEPKEVKLGQAISSQQACEPKTNPWLPALSGAARLSREGNRLIFQS